MSIVKIPARPGLFDWLGGDNKPDAVGYTTIDPDRWNALIDAPRVHNKHHGTAPADAVYIGRGSPWGNPYPIGEKYGNRAQVIDLFRVICLPNLDLAPLRGKHLVCFCKPQACHGDLLLEAANK